MIGKKLSKVIGSGKATTIHASITSEDMGKPCSIFDSNLSTLCTALRDVIPEVHFNSNSSAESYQICLPRMNESAAKHVVKLLTDTPISITASAHFGALF